MLSTVPETASASSAGLKALLTSAAFAPLPNVGWIRVTGSDRVRWLNGMVTNNIAALKPGEGCYNFFLNAQGRIQGDCIAWMQEDEILLEASADRMPALLTLLDHFIIMDDVELSPIENLAGIFIAGPQALPIVQALGTGGHQAVPCSTDPKAPATQSLNLKQTAYAGKPVSLLRAHSPLVSSFEIWSDPSTIVLILEELRGTLAVPASEEALEELRILSGTPFYGVDIRNSDAAKDLPQETNQTRALHFSKGCYLGQEIVERIRSRGAVHRTFGGFILDGDLPEPGAPLHDPAKPERPVGELTSVARIQLPNGITRQFALGYIRRETLDTRAAITYPGGTATPSTLPFPIS